MADNPASSSQAHQGQSRNLVRRFGEAMDAIPFGTAPLLILAVGLIAGAYLLANPPLREEGTLRLWVFSNQHYRAMQQLRVDHPDLADRFVPQLVDEDAVTSRLRAALYAGSDVADLVEVEITWAGSFFRGPIDQVGFVDLRPWLEERGHYDRLVRARFAPYSVGDRIFGMPKDVHPVLLAYNAERMAEFEEKYDFKMEQIETWAEFVDIGRKITRRGGANPRYMINLNDSGHDQFEVLLFQAGGGFFNEEGELIMDDELVVELLEWYIPLVAGPDRIGADAGWGAQFNHALREGYVLSYLAPDWRSRTPQNQIPDLEGKMKLMPLPAFPEHIDPTGRRTSTWGGTMVGITRHTQDPALAKELIERVYLDEALMLTNFRNTNILPPVRDLWAHEAFDEPNEYWSGQPLGRLYADVADEVPRQYTTPFTQLAKERMGQVISGLSRYYRRHGDEGFEAEVRRRLDAAAANVRREMRRNPF